MNLRALTGNQKSLVSFLVAILSVLPSSIRDCQSIYLSVCLSLCLSLCLSIYLSNYLRFYVVATSLGGWFVSKRSNSPKFKVTLSVSFSLLLLSSFAYVCHFCPPRLSFFSLCFLYLLQPYCGSPNEAALLYVCIWQHLLFSRFLSLTLSHHILPLSFLSSCKEFEMQGA